MDNKRSHISQRYDHELEKLRNHVMQMGSLVESQLASALKALSEEDVELGKEVMYADRKINAMEVSIDEECAQIIARRQPTASDLRLILAIIKTIADLERIGDEAEKIAGYAVQVGELGDKKSSYASLRNLGDQVKLMLKDALNVFARGDVEQALLVVSSDKIVDDEFDHLSRNLLTQMMEDPRNIKHCMSVTWCARSLERIGDHCQNICEYLIYLVEGKDIRHGNLDKK